MNANMNLTPPKKPMSNRTVAWYIVAGFLAFAALLASWGITLGPVLGLFVVAAVLIAKE